MTVPEAIPDESSETSVVNQDVSPEENIDIGAFLAVVDSEESVKGDVIVE